MRSWQKMHSIRICTYSSSIDKKNYSNSVIISYLILKSRRKKRERKYKTEDSTRYSLEPFLGRFSKPHFRGILRYKVVFSNVRCYIYACIWTRGCNASCDAAATNEGWGPWRVCAPSPYRVYNAPPPFLSPSLHPLARPPTIQLSPSPLFSPPIFTPGAPRYIPATLPGVT